MGLPKVANMKTLTKRLKLLVAGMTASLIAVSGLFLLVPAPAQAAPVSYDSMTVMDQAIVLNSAMAINDRRGNVERCVFKDRLSKADAASGKWMKGTLAGATVVRQALVGHAVNANEGNLGCDNENQWLSNLLAKAGYTGDLSVSAANLFTESNGEYIPKSNAKALLSSMIGTAIFGGNIPGSGSDAVRYATLFAAFRAESACNATESTSGSQIWVYDEATKTAVQKTFSFDSPGAIEVGYAGTGDGKLECGSIANLLGDAKYANAVKSNPNGYASASVSTAGEDPNLQCGTTSGFSPLNWILCPFIKLINVVVAGLDNAIISLLTVDQLKIFDTNNADPDISASANGYYKAWQVFRSLSLGILFVAALFMVIAQALGFQILDAYTIKKIFPRIIVAIIGIALSWEIMRFFVTLTNDLGLGVRQIIYFPFKDIDGPLKLSLGSEAITILLSSVALSFLGLAGLLSFGLTALLAVMVAFLVLIIRQMVIVVLILFAPIAIACYILPNTNGVWKLWYESFTKAMMMFPIIMAFLAVGRVLALTATGGSTTGGAPAAISQLIGFAAYFLPYFLIPLTFRFAGGAMRTLGGFTNDRSRGAFDRLKKYRGGKVAQNAHKLKTGSRWQDNIVSKPINNLGQRAGVGVRGRFGVGTRGKAAMDLSTRMAAADAMKDPRLNQLGFDDDGIMAMALSGGSASGARSALTRLRDNGAINWDDERINRAVSTAGAAEINRQNATAALDIMARNKSFSLPGGAAGMEAVVRSADAIAGVKRDASGQVIAGNKAMSDNLMGSFEFNSRQAGRNDLGMHDYATGRADLAKSWDKASLQQHSQGTSVSLQTFADDAKSEFFKGTTPEAKKKAAIRILEMQNALPYATAGNQKIINKLMSDVGVTFKPGGGSTEDQLAARLNAQFATMPTAAGSGAPTSGSALRGRARVYDQAEMSRGGVTGTPGGMVTPPPPPSAPGGP